MSDEEPTSGRSPSACPGENAVETLLGNSSRTRRHDAAVECGASATSRSSGETPECTVPHAARTSHGVISNREAGILPNRVLFSVSRLHIRQPRVLFVASPGSNRKQTAVHGVEPKKRGGGFGDSWPCGAAGAVTSRNGTGPSVLCRPARERYRLRRQFVRVTQKPQQWRAGFREASRSAPLGACSR